MNRKEPPRVDFVELSRVVSHALRHEPWLYGLELDDHGWTLIDNLLKALRKKSTDWTGLERQDLEVMISKSTKPRHEIEGSKIRALHGHSVPGHVHMEPSTPPDLLYHGTSVENLPPIMSDGLRPMGRQFVHLSQDIETALLVGRRKHGQTAILEINAKAAFHAGVNFYRRSDLVWLSARIVPRYIQILKDPL